MATVDLGVGSALGGGRCFGALSYSYTWITKTPMPAARGQGLLASLGGFLYYLGGQPDVASYGASTAVFKYDSLLDTWTTVTALPTARTSVMGGPLGGKIWLIWGHNNLTPYNNAIEYDPAGSPVTHGFSGIAEEPDASDMDPATNLFWTRSQGGGYAESYDTAATIAHVRATDGSPNGSGASGAFGPDGKFHIFGGSSTLNLHRIYDPATNTWASGTTIPGNGHGDSPGVVLKGTLLYVIGGRNNTASYQNTVRAFDTLTNTWSNKPSLPSVLAFIGKGATADSHGVWVAGGTDTGFPTLATLYCLPSPEVDLGAATAMGDGYAQAYASLQGTAMGSGSASHPTMEVHWSAARMYSGFTPLIGQRIIDFGPPERHVPYVDGTMLFDGTSADFTGMTVHNFTVESTVSVYFKWAGAIWVATGFCGPAHSLPPGVFTTLSPIGASSTGWDETTAQDYFGVRGWLSDFGFPAFAPTPATWRSGGVIIDPNGAYPNEFYGGQVTVIAP